PVNTTSPPLLEQIARYPERGSVVFWHIGDRLGRNRQLPARQEELTRFRAALREIRKLPEEDGHPVSATVEGELPLFARAPIGLAMIGIHPRIWSTAQNLLESYAYLIQRRALTVRSNLEGTFWAWLPAAPPSIVVRNIWGDDTPPAWGVPPVQPE